MFLVTPVKAAVYEISNHFVHGQINCTCMFHLHMGSNPSLRISHVGQRLYSCIGHEISCHSGYLGVIATAGNLGDLEHQM